MIIPCPGCGQPFESEHKDKNNWTRTRSTCGKIECINFARTRRLNLELKDHPVENCPFCHKPIGRHEGETRSNWQRRVTCGDIKCIKKSRVFTATNPPKLKPGEWPPGVSFWGMDIVERRDFGSP